MRAKKGDWVRIHSVVLKPEQRSPNIPEDTSKVPLELWVKGFLQEDAEIGAECEVITTTGRHEKGTLLEVNPTYTHSFGDYVPQIHRIGVDLKKALFEEGE